MVLPLSCEGRKDISDKPLAYTRGIGEGGVYMVCPYHVNLNILKMNYVKQMQQQRSRAKDVEEESINNNNHQYDEMKKRNRFMRIWLKI